MHFPELFRLLQIKLLLQTQGIQLPFPNEFLNCCRHEHLPPHDVGDIDLLTDFVAKVDELLGLRHASINAEKVEGPFEQSEEVVPNMEGA